MTERASIFQGVQIGVEVTPGTGVAANKRLPSLSIEPSPKVETKAFRAMGNKFPSLVIPAKELVNAKLSGPATYDEIVYLLSSLLSYSAPVQQGATAAYKWTHAPLINQADTIKTFTVEQGGAVRAHKFVHGLVTGLSLEFSPGGVELSGDMIGKALQDNVSMSTNAEYTLTAGVTPPTTGNFKLTFGGQSTANIAHNAPAAAVQAALEALSTIGAGNVQALATVAGGAGNLSVAGNVYTVVFVNNLGQAPRTLTGTFTTLDPSGSVTLAASVVGAAPTAVELMPVLPLHVNVYLADAVADLATAEPLNRVLSVGWELTDRFGPLYALKRAAGTSFDAVVEIEPKLTCKLKTEADAEGMALLSVLRAGTTRFLRIEAIGDAIEGDENYSLLIDTAVKVSDVSEFSDADGVFALEWTLAGVYDADWGKATQVEVVNTLMAL